MQRIRFTPFLLHLPIVIITNKNKVSKEERRAKNILFYHHGATTVSNFAARHKKWIFGTLVNLKGKKIKTENLLFTN